MEEEGRAIEWASAMTQATKYFTLNQLIKTSQTQDNLQNGRKYFVNDETKKGLISKMYEELIQLNNNNKKPIQK